LKSKQKQRSSGVALFLLGFRAKLLFRSLTIRKKQSASTLE
jgi:hypothetical protein